MSRNLLLPPKEGVRVKIRRANFYSDPVLPKIARQLSGLPIPFLFLLLLASPAGADSGDDLSSARSDFDRVQVTIVVRVRAIDPQRRADAWAQYYLALEQLQRMDVHQQMMTRHNQDRRAEFSRAHAEFRGALEQLARILVPAVKTNPE